MRRGQESFEFILVLAFVFLGFVLILQLQSEGIKAYAKEAIAVQAEGNLDYLSNAVRAVWREGKGSQRQVRIAVPAKTPTSITGRVITQTLPDTSTIAVETGIPISGALPTNPGTYTIQLTNNGTAVVVSYD